MKMEQVECSETSAYKIQTPGNYPKENIIKSIFSYLQKILGNKFTAMKTGLIQLDRDNYVASPGRVMNPEVSHYQSVCL